MKKILFLILISFLGFSDSGAQYTGTMGLDAATIIAQLEGQGVKVLNPTIHCRDSTYGTFRGVGDLGLDSGIVLSTNRVQDLFRPYNTAMYGRSVLFTTYEPDYDYKFDTSYFRTQLINWFGAESEYLVTGYSCGIEFDIVPANDKIWIEYIYVDDYLDSVPLLLTHYTYPYNFSPNHKAVCLCLPNANPLGIWVTAGSFGTDTVNYAVFPQDDVRYPHAPVNKYTLQHNSSYFSITCPSMDSTAMHWGGYDRAYYVRYNTNGARIPDINSPGFTIPMTAEIPVIPCDTLHMAIGTAWNLGTTTDCQIRNPSVSSVLLGKISSPGTDTACVSDTRIGTVSPEQLGLQLFPNPFQASLQFKSRHPQRIYQVQVIDVLGRQVLALQGNASSIQAQLDNGVLAQLPSQQLYYWRIQDTYTQLLAVYTMRKE